MSLSANRGNTPVEKWCEVKKRSEIIFLFLFVCVRAVNFGSSMKERRGTILQTSQNKSRDQRFQARETPS